ncbi:hypothetical protein TNCV_1441691 [Trichonephila clavipes]|uniref:Uncharacterized protein n=1 Tax=Trichonephila clavipes TaxID=2585209 RepID=A0A8X6RU26_TRICX|nr:hypothetical protein TNCV_1441691 [Trichonephila clavipes]
MLFPTKLPSKQSIKFVTLTRLFEQSSGRETKEDRKARETTEASPVLPLGANSSLGRQCRRQTLAMSPEIARTLSQEIRESAFAQWRQCLFNSVAYRVGPQEMKRRKNGGGNRI